MGLLEIQCVKTTMREFLLLFLVGVACGAPSGSTEGLCEVCHLLVGEVQDLVAQGSTQATISGYVRNVCADLPSNEKDACHTFMNENAETLFNKIITDLTPHEFCGQLPAVCPAYVAEEEPAEEHVTGILECELCKLAVLGVDKLIKDNNRSTAAINETLQKFCDSLPGELGVLCKKVEPDILKGLSQGFDPDVACKFAKLCTVAHPAGIQKIPCDVCYTVMDAIGVQDTESICAMQTTCQEESEKTRHMEEIKEQNGEIQDTLECQLCKFLVQAVDKLVGENRSIAAINSTLRDFCNGLPGELKDTCLNVEPDILKAILGGIDPTQACDFVKICNDGTRSPVSSAYIPCSVCKNTMEAIAGEKGVKICYQFKKMCGPTEEGTDSVEVIPVCEVCQSLIKSVTGLLSADRSRARVAEVVDTVCSNLPQQGRKFCMAYQEQVIDTIYEGVENPLSSCQLVDVCEDQEKNFLPDSQEIEESLEDAKCELCKFVVQLLDQYVEKNASIDKINATLYDLCNALPRSYQGVCFSIVPQIEAVVDAGLDPDNSCMAIKFCTESSRVISLDDVKCETCSKLVEVIPESKAQEIKRSVCKDVCPHRTRRSADTRVMQIAKVLKSANIGGVAECELCKVAIRTLDGLAGENASIAMINETVYEICTRLTGIQLQEICLKEAPTLAKVMKEGLDADKICTEAKLCTQDKEPLKKLSVRAKRQAIKSTSDKVGGLACDLCEEVLTMLDQLVGENATDEKINQTLYRLCSGLPDGELKDLCLKEAPMILQAIESGLDPKATCEKAQLCNDKVIRRKMRKRINVKKAFQNAANNVGDLACDLCEEVLTLLDQLVGDNATDEKINQTLYQLCSGLPDGFLKGLCLQEAPVILQTLEAGLDPKATCTMAKLCSNQVLLQKERKRVNVKQVFQEAASNVGGLACDLCEEVLTLLDQLVGENATDEKINQTLYRLCSGLPDGALKDLCLQEAPVILQAIESGLDPKATCEKAQLCSDQEFLKKSVIQINVEKEFQNAVGNVKDLKCEVCKGIIAELDSVIEKNASIAKINETVYGICASLKGSIQDLCLNFAPQLLAAIESGVDPTAACDRVDLCDGAQEMEAQPEPVNDIKCEICELIMIKVDKAIGQNASDPKINQTVYEVCKELSGTMQTFCLLVAPTIVKEVEKGADPNTACVSLKLCSHLEKRTTETKVGDIKCEICELLIQGLDNIVGKNGSDEKINATIYQLCGDLPGAAKSFCLVVAPTVVKEIEAGADPNKTCAQLNLCTSFDVVLSKPVGDIKCDICELIIQGLDSLIGTNASDAKINATIFKLCNDLSGSARTFCLNVAPTIVQEVEKGADPEKTCATLKLCTSETDVEVSLPSLGASIDCNTCIRSLGPVFDDVYGNYLKVQRPLQNLCNNLPLSFRPKCLQFVTEDNGVLLKFFLRNYTPTLLCEMAKCL